VRGRGIRIGGSVLLVVVVALSIFLATRHTVSDATNAPSPLLGKIAPTASGTTLDGAHLSLASDLGSVVVLTFWASWCEPCQQEAPDLSTFAFQQQHGGAKVLGVVFNDPVSSAKNFQRYYGSLYPSIIDPNGTIANEYGVTAPPTTFIINRHGRVVAELLGATTARQLTAVVDRVSS